MYKIDKTLWTVCRICDKSLMDIKKDYGGGNKYFSEAFRDHIKKEHGMSLAEYFENIVGIERPTCKCGVCNKKTEVTIKGSEIGFRESACGRNIGQQKWSEEAKTTRIGSGNPMYGQKAWNFGLDTSDPRVKAISDHKIGKITPEDVKKKQSESAKKRLIHGHTGFIHSEETKEFLRENTLNMIKRGVFEAQKTKPFVAMSLILDEMDINYEEEKRCGNFCFDFWLIDYNVFLEVDGDYFHSNPKFYPDGPESYTQKINLNRDFIKEEYCRSHNKNLIRFWECDILKDREKVKETILCTLNQLKQSDTLENNQQ